MNGSDCAIVIPVYNGERYLEAALASAVNQTVKVPIIIVDDGSTDSTSELLGQRRNGVTVLRQENGGTSSAWNHALRSCQATWLVGLDADDELEPTAVQELLKQAKRSINVDLFYSDYSFIDLDGQLVRQVRNPAPVDPVAQLLRLHDRLGQPDNFVPFGHVRMYRREALVAAGGYDESYLYAEDFELLFRMARLGAVFQQVPAQLYRYRWHTTNKGVLQRPQQVADVRRTVFESGLR
jgi:glycosyltransferase involved in cell wall biosynthesis